MVDGVLLLVAPPRGLCRETPSCCASARVQVAGYPRDQPVDLAGARLTEVVDECPELFLDLDADDSNLLPIVYCNASRRASLKYNAGTDRG